MSALRWVRNLDDALELREGHELLAGVYLTGGRASSLESRWLLAGVYLSGGHANEPELRWKAVRYRAQAGAPIGWHLVGYFDTKRHAMAAVGPA